MFLLLVYLSRLCIKILLALQNQCGRIISYFLEEFKNNCHELYLNVWLNLVFKLPDTRLLGETFIIDSISLFLIGLWRRFIFSWFRGVRYTFIGICSFLIVCEFSCHTTVHNNLWQYFLFLCSKKIKQHNSSEFQFFICEKIVNLSLLSSSAFTCEYSFQNSKKSAYLLQFCELLC